MKQSFLFSTILAVSTIVIAPTADAHGNATGVVKERMDAMEEMKESVKTLSSIFKGEQPYQADQIREAAKAIHSHAGDKITKLFPKGSLQGHSEAKANIWQEWPQFQALANQLELTSQGLYDAADNQEDSSKKSSMMMSASSMMGGMAGGHMGSKVIITHTAAELASMPSSTVFELMTDTCSSCHTRFRQEDEH